jgi:hypothetical protein
LFFVLLAARYADHPSAKSGARLFLMSLLLFFSHALIFLFANAIGAAFLRLSHRRSALGSCGWLPYVGSGLLGAACTFTHLASAEHVHAPGLFWQWNWGRLAFVHYAWGAFPIDLILAPGAALMFAAPWLLKARLHHRRSLAFVPMAALLSVWAFVPSAALATGYLYQRFALFLLPFYTLMFRRPKQEPANAPVVRLLLPVICCIFLAYHSECLLSFAKETADFDALLVAAAPGQRALSMALDARSEGARNPALFLHYAAWYQAEKHGLVDFNFAGATSTMVVQYKHDHRPAVGAGFEWNPGAFNWKIDGGPLYRYFFVRHTAPVPEALFEKDHCPVVLVKSVGTWSLYERLPQG